MEYTQVDIDRNVERIKKVAYSQAYMKPPKGAKLTPADQEETDAWKRKALGYWRKQQNILDKGVNDGKEKDSS